MEQHIPISAKDLLSESSVSDNVVSYVGKVIWNIFDNENSVVTIKFLIHLNTNALPIIRNIGSGWQNKNQLRLALGRDVDISRPHNLVGARATEFDFCFKEIVLPLKYRPKLVYRLQE